MTSESLLVILTPTSLLKPFKNTCPASKPSKPWRVKLNEAKSAYVTFIFRHQSCHLLLFNDIPIPTLEQVHYLGLYLDRRLTWNPHTRLKRIDQNRKNELLGKNFILTMDNKLTI